MTRDLNFGKVTSIFAPTQSTGKCEDDKYGLFKIDHHWCKLDGSDQGRRRRGVSPGCNVACAKLLDGRLHDDVKCLEQIIQQQAHSVQSLWPEATEHCCAERRWKQYIKVSSTRSILCSKSLFFKTCSLLLQDCLDIVGSSTFPRAECDAVESANVEEMLDNIYKEVEVAIRSQEEEGAGSEYDPFDEAQDRADYGQEDLWGEAEAEGDASSYGATSDEF